MASRSWTALSSSIFPAVLLLLPSGAAADDIQAEFETFRDDFLFICLSEAERTLKECQVLFLDHYCALDFPRTRELENMCHWWLLAKLGELLQESNQQLLEELQRDKQPVQ